MGDLNYNLKRLAVFYEAFADHHLRSGCKEKAIEYLELANQKAADLNAMEKAKAYFDQIMHILDKMPESNENERKRISILMKQIWVFEGLLMVPEYYELLAGYEFLVVDLGDPVLLAAFYTELAMCEWWLGYLDRAIETSAKAAQLNDHRYIEGGTCPYLVFQWIHLWKGEYDKVISLKENVLRFMKQCYSLQIHLRSLAAVIWAYSHLGKWDQAIEEGENALNMAERFSNNSMISYSAFSISVAYSFKRDWDHALEYAKLAAQKALTPADKLRTQGAIDWAFIFAGEPLRGIELATTLLPTYRAEGFAGGELIAILGISEAYGRVQQ